VKLLDEADELRKMRAEADRRTANLIPALFNEMFGAHAQRFITRPRDVLVTIMGMRAGQWRPHKDPPLSRAALR
jgi:hypothetical protein